MEMMGQTACYQDIKVNVAHIRLAYLCISLTGFKMLFKSLVPYRHEAL